MVTRTLTGVLFALLIGGAPRAFATHDDERAVERAQQRWRESKHGPMLERILPPTFSAGELPDPQSAGARLLLRYCVQCHHLANPAMHEATKWPRVVDRMVGRIAGRGNMGGLMKEMMDGVSAPNAGETATIIAYLQKHAQQPIDAARYPDLAQPSGQSFRLACQQCHVLPDPHRHSASEWPRVVARMERNMAWMNRVVGNQLDPREPQLSIREINEFLARYARNADPPSPAVSGR